MFSREWMNEWMYTKQTKNQKQHHKIQTSTKNKKQKQKKQTFDNLVDAGLEYAVSVDELFELTAASSHSKVICLCRHEAKANIMNEWMNEMWLREIAQLSANHPLFPLERSLNSTHTHYKDAVPKAPWLKWVLYKLVEFWQTLNIVNGVACDD